MTVVEAMVHGHCDEKFAAVRRAFAENLASNGDVGAAVAVTIDGETVVDLWGGWADRARTRPWERDTLVTVYSTTKGLTAIAAHRLVEEGKLDLNKPAAHYWPEFAQAGKADVPVHMLLSHRAGLPTVDRKLPPGAIYDWEMMTNALAESTLFWEPGTRHGYHGLTYGWLVGELVRRVSGTTFGTFFRTELAMPLRLDAHIGIGPEHDHRIAEMIAPEVTPEVIERRAMIESRLDPKILAAQGNIQLEPDVHNSEGWKRSEIPAANGHSDARSLARVYGALSMNGEIDGVHVLSPEAIRDATAEQAAGPDAMLQWNTRFAQGFWLSTIDAPMGPSSRNFGHPGSGGSVGFADPDRHIGFGYVMNRMKAGLLVGGTGQRLTEALYASI